MALDIIVTSPLPCHLGQVVQPVEALEAPIQWTQMPGVGLVLHFLGNGDLWELGQGGTGHRLQAGFSPSHSPLLLQANCCGQGHGRFNITLVCSITRAILARAPTYTILTAFVSLCNYVISFLKIIITTIMDHYIIKILKMNGIMY